jgi:glycosyltransferase involved in cell wall biosynthesis
MKVLLVHNHYQQRGGEDTVVEAEAELLSSRGHAVLRYGRHNDEIRGLSASGKLRLAVGTTWARDTHHELRSMLARERPDVAHFHNTFPLVSPSAYYACNAAGVPVVQTVHNFRLLCPAATLLREQRICEDCVGRLPWPGVLHACYHDSRAESMVIAVALSAHRIVGTYRQRVQRYLALTELGRELLIRGGLPADRIAVKPNFVSPDPGYGEAIGDYVIFVGRLAHEKGILSLLDAWKQLPNIPLRIIGDGPLRAEVEARASSLAQARVLGQLPRDAVFEQLRGARLFVFPSEWYEGLPMVLLEAMATGVPIVASRVGPIAEAMEGGRLGTLFRPKDADNLAHTVREALSNPSQLRAKALAARAAFERKYTAQVSYELLLSTYQQAREQMRVL